MVDLGIEKGLASDRLPAPAAADQRPVTVRLTTGAMGARADVGDWEAVVSRAGEEGVLLYGPYEERGRGAYVVNFQVAATQHPEVLGDPICLTLDVVANNGLTILAERRLLLSELSQAELSQAELSQAELSQGPSTISLPFRLHERRVVEYRVRSSGQIGLQASCDVVVQARPGTRPPPTGLDSRERAWRNEREFLDGYLRNVSGLIHVGANLGQERRYYWLLGLDVIWVEPIRELYEQLVDRIASYDRQYPINALLADQDGREFDFKIANNGGASSSILPFEDHEKLWPDIKYVETRKLVASRLDTLMSREGISTANYQALTLDVEGAELLVLKGAGDVLRQFRYVKCEVADFPARTGTPTADDLDALMRDAGFSQLIRRAFAMGPDGMGTYWDIVWKRVRPGEDLQAPGIRTPLVADPQDVAAIEKCE